MSKSNPTACLKWITNRWNAYLALSNMHFRLHAFMTASQMFWILKHELRSFFMLLCSFYSPDWLLPIQILNLCAYYLKLFSNWNFCFTQHSHWCGDTRCYWPSETTEEGTRQAPLPSKQTSCECYFIHLPSFYFSFSNWNIIYSYICLVFEGPWRKGRKSCSWDFAWNYSYVWNLFAFIFLW